VESILAPSITLNGHRKQIQSISYFSGGQRMIGSSDKITRQWDVKTDKENEEAQNFFEAKA
jgi:WD40 repeat protein